jgi:hypothetical protein
MCSLGMERETLTPMPVTRTLNSFVRGEGPPPILRERESRLVTEANKNDMTGFNRTNVDASVVVNKIK